MIENKKVITFGEIKRITLGLEETAYDEVSSIFDGISSAIVLFLSLLLYIGILLLYVITRVGIINSFVLWILNASKQIITTWKGANK